MKLKIIAALPAPDWVVERTAEDGTRSVYPCAGFAVDESGEIHALPLSLGAGWTVRPATESDASAIRRTGARLAQRPVTAPFGTVLFNGQWVEDVT
jgi:hypothetical protein